MAINKVNYGDRILMDLTQDTVTPEMLLAGKTAHDKTGELIRGTHVPFSGQYDDLKGKPETFPPAPHNQGASTITGGTFGGTVYAGSSYQNPGSYCLRNSKLSNTGEKPTVNGQTVIGYGGKPSSVMVGGTVYPVGGGGGSTIQWLYNGIMDGEKQLQRPFTDYDLIVIGIYTEAMYGMDREYEVLNTGMFFPHLYPFYSWGFEYRDSDRYTCTFADRNPTKVSFSNTVSGSGVHVMASITGIKL